MSSFKGTSFESLENKILNDLNRKKRSAGSSSAAKNTKSKNSSKPVHKSVSKTVSKFSSSRVEQILTSSSSKAASVPKIRSEPENSFNNDRTVYVQGIPFVCTEKEVTDFFKPCGDIVSIRLPKWHDSGNLKGYGHVEFKNVASAEKALELSGQYLKDRYVMVDRPQTPRVLQNKVSGEATTSSVAPIRPQGCRTIFIKNLPYEITENELKTAFMVYGPITNIRLPVWGHTKNLKGFGYIEFKREDSAEIAVKKSGTLLVKERVISADFETGIPKGSFKGNKDASKLKAKSSFVPKK